MRRPELKTFGTANVPALWSTGFVLDAGRRNVAAMELHEALYTTRAMRRVKKDPIPLDVQARILDAAVRAPSGGNQQNWRFLLLDDPDKKAALGPPVPARHRRALEDRLQGPTRRGGHATPTRPSRCQMLKVQRSAQWLADHFEDVPLYMFPFSQYDPTGGSIYPACGARCWRPGPRVLAAASPRCSSSSTRPRRSRSSACRATRAGSSRAP